jgi:lipopolysaccharide export system protein LptA
MTYRSKEDLIIFEGEVVAHQGEMTLHGDHVEVRVDQKTQEIRTVHATGNVRILKEDLVATGEVADYDALAGVAVLTGNPKVWRGKDVVVGEKITVFLADNRSVVEGKVKAVIFPPPKKPETERK